MSEIIVAIKDTLEKTTPSYTAKIIDADDAAIPSGSINVATLTYFNRSTGTKIRDAQNILNTNGVTIDSSGNIEWILTQADTTIEDDSKHFEEYMALFEIQYSGTKHLKHRVIIRVENVETVT